MLRNRGIRSKLLAAMALPTAVLLVAALVLSGQAFLRARQAANVKKLAVGAPVIGALVKSVQAEALQAVAVRDGTQLATTLAPVQAATDKNLKAANAFISGVNIKGLSPAAVAAVTAANKAHAGLPKLRSQVASGNISTTEISSRYSEVLALDVALPQRIGDALEDREIGRNLAAYSALQNIISLSYQEQNIGAKAVIARGADRAAAVQFAALAKSKESAIQYFQVTAPTEIRAAFDRGMAPSAAKIATYTAYSKEISTSAVSGSIRLTGPQWQASTSAYIQDLTRQAQPLANATADSAAQAATNSQRKALLILVLSIVLLIAVVMLGLLLARSLIRPVRQLTESATAVAEELPRMIERMAAPGAGPGVALPDLSINSSDEVGQLALAFKNVNDTTIRVATEQAALRASIAEMFVNVARRNHVLLSRQLTFIDQLERTEENPDTLEELFRLDHLATRMRRNAESLIVLAGVDAGRRLRHPMPLSDVVRTAVSEIERYDRVDLTLETDPKMAGHVALMAAHLLAELLENATQFSKPDTRVAATTSLTSQGIRVSVTDQGLGMTWEEVNEANARIAKPPVAEAVGSQRLGFYVVGRLAQRLDALVVLRPGRSRGTVVTIDLPPALFVDGANLQLPSAKEDAARLPSDWEIVDKGDSGPSATAPTPQLGLPSVPEVGPTPAPAAPARTGIFAGFRARRQADPEAGATADLPAPAVAETPAADAFAPAASPPAIGRIPLPDPNDYAPYGATLPPEPADPTPIPAAAPQSIGGNPDDRLAVLAPETENAQQSVVAEPIPSDPIPGDLIATDSGGPAADWVAPSDAVWSAFTEPSSSVPETELDVQPRPPVVESPPTPAAVETSPQVTAEPSPPVEPAAEISPLDPAWSAFDEAAPAVRPDSATPSVAVPPSVVPAAAEVIVPEEIPPAFEPTVAAPQTQPRSNFEPPVSGFESPHEEPSPEFAATRPEVPNSEPSEEPVLGTRMQRRHPGSTDSVAGPAPAASDPFAAFEQSDSEPVPQAPVASPGPALPPVPEPELAPTAVTESAPAAPPAPPPTVVMTPTGAGLNILPERTGGRGLFRRRPAPIVPSAPTSPAPQANREAIAAVISPQPVVQPVERPSPTPAPSLAGIGASRSAGDSRAFSVPQLPDREPVAPSAAPAPAPEPPAALSKQSELAANLLSELSSANYTPATVQTADVPVLKRRTPLATEAAKIAEPEDPVGNRRGNRNATDVRTMLSGFRAGVERGRTSPGGAADPE